MKNVYLDNACTSYPKAPGVSKAMYDYMENGVTNINRSTYRRAIATEDIVLDLRCNLDKFFNGYGEENVVFTRNITESLNIVIKGFLKDGDHVLTSSMEHNAVIRPLVKLTEKGVTFDRIPCDNEGNLFIDKIESLIRENTKAIILAYANNVCGAVYPIDEIGKIAKKHNIKFVIDSAQAAGVLPIDMKKQNIDVLCFTGHKSLLGPQGIGGFLVTPEIAKSIDTFIEGGTGSISDKEIMPDFMPDKFEAGTLNIPNIIGLHTSMKYLNEIGIDKIKEKELSLTKLFIDNLQNLIKNNKVKLIGPKNLDKRVGVISISCPEKDIANVAFLLDDKYNISVRTGLHCAPSTHKTLGTFPTGTIRFSFGYFNTEDDIRYATNALTEILS